LTGERPVSGAAAAAAAADNVVSKQEALKQHKEWLVNFRRDMSLVSASVADHHVSTVQCPIPAEQSSLTS